MPSKHASPLAPVHSLLLTGHTCQHLSGGATSIFNSRQCCVHGWGCKTPRVRIVPTLTVVTLACKKVVTRSVMHSDVTFMCVLGCVSSNNL